MGTRKSQQKERRAQTMKKLLSLLAILSLFVVGSYEHSKHYRSTTATRAPESMGGVYASWLATQPATSVQLVSYGYGTSRPANRDETSPRVLKRSYRSRPANWSDYRAARQPGYRSRPVTRAEIEAAKRPG